jgi:hypothetical protein
MRIKKKKIFLVFPKKPGFSFFITSIFGLLILISQIPINQKKKKN